MKILAVNKSSTGAELGLQPGDKIEAIDGSRVKDIIDYRFKISDENILLRVRKSGEVQEYEVEKDYDDDLGLEFEDFQIRKCANDCVFCFVDQNPPGMRDALYFRDGDFRLSFLHGHYITMTNMGWKELKRVVEQRLTPLYISVHVTQPDKRLEMFLYKKDDLLLKKFEYLTENGIELHSQIVLCPNWNDGKFLEQTIKDIHQFSPMARSMSIVPAGLTKHRDGLPYIAPVTVDYAKEFVPFAEKIAEKYKLADGRRFVFLSDEWFLMTNEMLPATDYYEDSDLSENGVGQVPYFWENWQKEISLLPNKIDNPKRVTVCTGTLISDWFKCNWIPTVEEIENLEINHLTILNEFYGSEEVTVSGLLVGRDIINQLKGKDLGDMVIFSDRILSETGTVTLDDMSLERISEEVGTPVVVTDDTPQSFFNLLK
jgi:putative radical SAM enzyme (TIGR03279 family)